MSESIDRCSSIRKIVSDLLVLLVLQFKFIVENEDVIGNPTSRSFELGSLSLVELSHLTRHLTPASLA